MLENYNSETKILTIGLQQFAIDSRKRVRGYEYFKFVDGRNLISDGNIYLYTPISSYGVRQLNLYHSRPPIPQHLLPLTKDSLLYSVEDGLAVYLGVTGACEGGYIAFLKSLIPPKFPCPVIDLVKITKGKYGSDILEEYLNPTGKVIFFGSQNKDGSIIWTPRHPQLSDKEMLNLELQSVLQ